MAKKGKVVKIGPGEEEWRISTAEDFGDAKRQISRISGGEGEKAFVNTYQLSRELDVQVAYVSPEGRTAVFHAM